MAVRVDPGFARTFIKDEKFNASACMNCGCCTAICPMETGILARKLFRYVMLGREDKIRENAEVIFSCLLCKLCEEGCPADVNIVENIRILRKYLIQNVYKI